MPKRFILRGGITLPPAIIVAIFVIRTHLALPAGFTALPRTNATRIDFPPFEARGMPLDAALVAWQQHTGLALSVRWEELKRAGVPPDAPVTVRLFHVTPLIALQTILSDAGGGTVALSFREEKGRFLVSTADDLNRDVVTRSYSVGDILRNIEREQLQPPPMFSPSLRQLDPTDWLRRMVRETVNVNAWREHGGRYASEYCVADRLVVVATEEDQQGVEALLYALRNRNTLADALASEVPIYPAFGR